MLRNISCTATVPGFNLGDIGENDEADSIANNTSFTVRFYSYAGGSSGGWNWIATLARGGDTFDQDNQHKKNRI